MLYILRERAIEIFCLMIDDYKETVYLYDTFIVLFLFAFWPQLKSRFLVTHHDHSYRAMSVGERYNSKYYFSNRIEAI